MEFGKYSGQILVIHISDRLLGELWEKSSKSFKCVVRDAKADLQ